MCVLRCCLKYGIIFKKLYSQLRSVFWRSLKVAVCTIFSQYVVLLMTHCHSRILIIISFSAFWDIQRCTFENIHVSNNIVQITEKDEEVLEYLVDVRSEEIYPQGEEEEDEGVEGFTLTFEFSENPFFTNKTLVSDSTISMSPGGKEAISNQVVSKKSRFKYCFHLHYSSCKLLNFSVGNHHSFCVLFAFLALSWRHVGIGVLTITQIPTG